MAFSNTSPLRKNIPFLAHKPFATTFTSGTARPKAHGHATTRIVTKCVRESAKDVPTSKCIMNVNMAITIIIGTI